MTARCYVGGCAAICALAVVDGHAALWQVDNLNMVVVAARVCDVIPAVCADAAREDVVGVNIVIPPFFATVTARVVRTIGVAILLVKRVIFPVKVKNVFVLGSSMRVAAYGLAARSAARLRAAWVSNADDGARCFVIAIAAINADANRA